MSAHASARRARAKDGPRQVRSAGLESKRVGQSERSGDLALGRRFFCQLFFAARQRKVGRVRSAERFQNLTLACRC